jgi:hypothetical protein
MNVNAILILIAVYLCQSCGFAYEEHIVGNYYIVAVDSDSDAGLSYMVNEGSFIGVIPSVVFSVGHDSKFVFVKQHPDGPNGKINYFIVPIEIKNKYKVDEEVIGPLNENQFNAKLIQLGVSKTDDLFQVTLQDK